MTREEMVAKEQASWEALLAQVELVPEDRRETPGAVPGWSAQDLVRHCVVWVRDITPAFEGAASGPWADPFEGISDETFEEMNQRYAEESKAMTWAEIEAEAAEWRPRLRNAFLAMSGPDPAADECFAEETYVHYDEHAEHIGAFASQGGRGR
jgi:hypothetical protein